MIHKDNSCCMCCYENIDYICCLVHIEVFAVPEFNSQGRTTAPQLTHLSPLSRQGEIWVEEAYEDLSHQKHWDIMLKGYLEQEAQSVDSLKSASPCNFLFCFIISVQTHLMGPPKKQLLCFYSTYSPTSRRCQT